MVQEGSRYQNGPSRRDPGLADATISDLSPVAASRQKSWSGTRCSEGPCSHCHQPSSPAASGSVGRGAGPHGGRQPPRQGWTTSGWRRGTTLDGWCSSSASEIPTDGNSRRSPGLGCSSWAASFHGRRQLWMLHLCSLSSL